MKNNVVITSWKLMKYNIRALLGFEIILKLFLTLIGMPILFGLLQYAMDLQGYHYLDTISIMTFMRESKTILIMIVALLIMTLITMMEIQAIIVCYQYSANQQHLRITDMVYIGVKNAFLMFRRKNILLILFVLCMVPLTYLAAITGLFASIPIAEFIRTYSMSHTILCIMFVFLMAIATFISLRWIFSLHAYTCSNMNFKEARLHSLYLMRGNYIRTIIYYVVWQLIQFLIAFFIVVIVGGICVFVIKVCVVDVVGYGMAIRAISFSMRIVYLLLLYMSVPISFALLSALYTTYQKEKQCACVYNKSFITITKQTRRYFIIFLTSIFIISMYQTWNLQQRDANIVHELKEVPEITAHRGDSVHAPENSIPAFEKAMQANADWIELDVHQTSDGVVVVTHDADLKRIAGVDKRISEMRYEELLQYDVGSWFSSTYQGLQVATLEEVVALCKGKVKLNIELKPTGQEANFEQHVIAIINAYDIKDACVISSLHKKVLKMVKKLDPSIATIYTTRVAIEDVSDISFADSVSVEASFITEELLDAVHKQGKKLTAWTVNQEENVKRMIALGVDNIVTDNPSGVYTIIYENRTNAWIAKLLLNIF